MKEDEKYASAPAEIASAASTSEKKNAAKAKAKAKANKKAEKIIAVNPYIYEEVVTQCINYLTDQNSSWPLAAFVLIKEKYDTQLKQFLELHCEET